MHVFFIFVENADAMTELAHPQEFSILEEKI